MNKGTYKAANLLMSSTYFFIKRGVADLTCTELKFPEEEHAGQPVNIQQQGNGVAYQQGGQSQSPGQYQQQQFQQVIIYCCHLYEVTF
jgi:hypothetical protein